MKILEYIFIAAMIALAMCIGAGFLVLGNSIGNMLEPHRTVSYDCRIAEISPDFPPEVREACRKMNVQK